MNWETSMKTKDKTGWGGTGRWLLAALTLGAWAAVGTAAAQEQALQENEVKTSTGTLVPGVINYQGCLQLADGTPLKGIQHMTFSIYDAAIGGSLIWARAFPVTCTDEGVFNVLLEDGGTLVGQPAEAHLSDAFQGTARYLELAVEGYGALLPRRKFTTAPYAIQAQYGLWADGNFTVGQSMSVSNLAMMQGGLTVSNTATVASLTANQGGSMGDATFAGSVTVPAGQTNEARGVIPRGGILMWTQSSVPDGWAVCNGQNGTPDLQGLFVMGASSTYGQGTTGGLERVTLTLDQIPSHSHTYVYPNGKGEGSILARNDNGHIWRYDTTKTTTSAGGGQAHENRPPYYALYYIMRIR